MKVLGTILLIMLSGIVGLYWWLNRRYRSVYGLPVVEHQNESKERLGGDYASYETREYDRFTIVSTGGPEDESFVQYSERPYVPKKTKNLKLEITK